ncbi:MAG: fluoride efflux transporter CrcB [Acidobacteriia bacterium]|nr:fluoride efflux transporter CrcB [Terriglobia bacterium]
MHKIAFLACAGACGTLARYILQGWAQRVFGGEFPWGTLVVNSVGCFAFGLIWAIAEERFLMRPEWRAVLLIGFLGAFTTFSSFVFETAELFRDTQWQMAILNLVGQNVLGLVLFFLGLFLGRIF